MKKRFILLIIVTLSISNYTYSSDIREMKHHGSWWIENYGVISAEDDPLVTRAEDVFKRVSMASDKRGNREPRLLIIRSKGDPWAISLKDGTIVLTHGALNVCYRGVTEEVGDSRLAFLQGHELAHLSNNDFWHAFAFTAVEKNVINQGIRKVLKEQLEKTGDIKKDDPGFDMFVMTKELKADSNGIIYMAIAGYDPRAIVDDGSNFFEEWVSQTTSALAYEDHRHNSPKERSAFLRSHLSTVVEIIDYFTFGVDLYQLGRYADALLFFEAFSERFPGREVYNNQGLAHYQLAMRFLSSCDRELPLRFKLSTIFDTETRAIRIRGGMLDRGYRGESVGRSDCLDDKIFLQNINNATGYFNLALDRDPTYLPARINLSSALILTGKYSNAMGMAKEVLLKESENLDALNNWAVAVYLLGLNESIDTADNAISVLKEISGLDPGFSSAIYNMAAIQSERGRKASAQEMWKAFLRVETRGTYADAARRNTGVKTDQSTIASGIPKLKSPIRLGEITGDSAETLNRMENRDFIIGKFTGEIYEESRIKALAIDNVVEVVERQVDKKIGCEKFIEDHGEPVRVRNNNYGKTLIYNDFAADVMNGNIKKVIYFKGNQG